MSAATQAHRDSGVRPYLLIIRTASLLVPAVERGEWRNEWSAEVIHRRRLLDGWRGRGSRLRLARICTGAFDDALTVRLLDIGSHSRVAALAAGFEVLRSKPLASLGATAAVAVSVTLCSILALVGDALYVRDLPMEHGGRIAVVRTTFQDDERQVLLASDFEFARFRDRAKTIESVSATYATPGSMAIGSTTQPVVVGHVTPSFFGVSSLEPELGATPRDFVDASDRPVVISNRYWRAIASSDTDLLGKVVVVDGQPRTVVAVAADGFEPPGKCDVWIPATPRPRDGTRAATDQRYLTILGRVAPGRSMHDVADEADEIARVADSVVSSRGSWGATAVGLKTVMIGERSSTSVAFAIVVGLLSLVLSVTALWGIRNGGSRVEPSIVAFAGLVAGAVFTWMALASHSVLDGRVGTDVRALLPIAAISIVVFGAGALVAATPGRPRAIRVGARALCAALVIVAGLAWLQIGQLRRANSPFLDDHLVACQSTPPNLMQGGDPTTAGSYVDATLARLRSDPAILSVAASSVRPLGSDTRWSVVTDARHTDTEVSSNTVWRAVSPGFFATLGITVVEGRELATTDDAAGELAVTVNRAFAQRQFPGESAIGHRVQLVSDETSPWRTIVGVVPDLPQGSIDGSVEPEVFLPFSQFEARRVVFIARGKSELDSRGFASAIGRATNGVPVFDLGRTADEVERQLAWRSTLVWTLLALAAVAAVVSALTAGLAVGQRAPGRAGATLP